MIASEKPRSSMTRPSATYMTPMRLWSTLVSHSRHRYGHQPFTVTVTRIARMARPTTAPLSSGSGSLNGIASQVSLPSMSISRVTHCRSSGFRTRRRLVEDALEQLGFDRAIGCGWYGFARLGQLSVTGIVESGSGAAHLFEPNVEIAGRHRLDYKPHVGKTVAAEHRREAGILARLVGKKVEMCDHAAHRVDLAAELRHEERIHHRRRGEPKFDGRSGRDDQLIDGGDTVVGVDEQPFPIERHDVHAQLVGFAGDRRPRIELMGPDPNDAAQQDHGQRRDRPGDELHAPFIGLVQAAGGTGVGGAVPPGERQGGHDHGNHDDEHDSRRIDQEKSFRRRDRSFRIEDASGAAAERCDADQGKGEYGVPHIRLVRLATIARIAMVAGSGSRWPGAMITQQTQRTPRATCPVASLTQGKQISPLRHWTVVTVLTFYAGPPQPPRAHKAATVLDLQSDLPRHPASSADATVIVRRPGVRCIRAPPRSNRDRGRVVVI